MSLRFRLLLLSLATLVLPWAGCNYAREMESALREHMSSWDYAFAMGSSRDGASEHPRHKATRDQTEQLKIRCRDLRARLAEHEL